MRPDELIEHLNKVNAEKRMQERMSVHSHRAWWLAVPAAASIALLLALPMHSSAEPQYVTGVHVYCNNNCHRDDALAMIRQNIDEITKNLSEQ